MCGLVGVGDFSKRGMAGTESNLFLDLIIAGCVRGKHGTGIVKIDTKGNSDWRKMEGNPFELFNAEGIAAWYDDMKKDYRFYFGHNRHATTGTRSKDHAHPFTQGHITLAHNGTLFQTTNTPNFKDFAVDSEAMAFSISKIGIQETINKTYGAYCIVYWDDKEKTLNLLRNKERPLYIGVDAGWNRMAFASEFGMLAWCAHRNQIKLDVEVLEEDTLYTYSLKSETPKKIPMKKIWVSYGGYDSSGLPFTDGRNSKFYEEHEYLKLGTVWQYLKKGSKHHKQALAQEAREREERIKANLPAVVKQTELKLVANKDELKAPFPKSGKGTDVLQNIDNLFGYHVGDRIGFIIVDYDKIPGDKYLLTGKVVEFKGLDIFMHISAKGPTLDTLLETFKVRGTIRHMRFNLDNTKNDSAHHQMWLSDPEPVFSLMKEEEASLVIDGATGGVIDPFQDPFESDDAKMM